MRQTVKLSSDEIKTLIRALCQSQHLLIQESEVLSEVFFLKPEYKEEERLKIKLRAILKGNLCENK